MAADVNPVTSDGWRHYLPEETPSDWATRLEHALDGAARDCRAFAAIAQEVKLNEWWKDVAQDWEQFCRDWLKREPEFVSAVVAGAHVIGYDAPVPERLAVAAGLRVRAAATDTNKDKLLPADGSVNPSNARQFAAHSQPARAAEAGISERSQRTLDALARKAPELLKKVQAGELSCHAAAVQAGIVKAVWSAPVDLDLLQQALAKRYPGWQLTKKG